VGAAEDISLTLREQISQAGGQAFEGLGDIIQKNQDQGVVMKEVAGLANFSSSTTSA